MIKTKKRDDPDAFSKNQYKTLWETKKGGQMRVNLLNGEQEYVPPPKKRCR